MGKDVPPSLGETMSWLEEKLRDPNYDILDNYVKVHDRLHGCLEVIDGLEAKSWAITHVTTDLRGRWHRIFVQYLVRLRSASPHLFHCETLGWDLLHDDLEKLWAKRGLIDVDGFQWPMPRIFGPYNMSKP